MALTKLTSTDAFVVTDVPDAPAAGVVRMGKKILQSSAKDLARSATYSFAAFGIERGGASAGINAEEESDQVTALAAFLDEVASLAAVELTAGKGVRNDQLGQLRHPHAGSDAVRVSGIVAAAKWANGGSIEGASVAVEGQGDSPTADLLARSLADAGAVVHQAKPDAKPWMIWASDVELLFAGSKPGTLTHQGAPTVKAKAVIPWSPIPVTTKAYLMLERSGVKVLPDFVTAAGGLIGPYLPDSPTDGAELAVLVGTKITDVLESSSGHDEGTLMGACLLAEDFLATWSDFSPFGRPLAT